MNFSTINSLCIKRNFNLNSDNKIEIDVASSVSSQSSSELLIVRCSTCLISFFPDYNIHRNTADSIFLESCLGDRIPSNVSGFSSSSSSLSLSSSSLSPSLSSSSSTLSSLSVFLENGFQIRCCLSPDSLYYLCPSSKNPWNNSSCTLIIGTILNLFFIFICIFQ
jgi:hypothetical protein